MQAAVDEGGVGVDCADEFCEDAREPEGLEVGVVVVYIGVGVAEELLHCAVSSAIFKRDERECWSGEKGRRSYKIGAT